jgi:transcription antitermination factor NusB
VRRTILRIETQAREAALKALYQHDLLGNRTMAELRSFCRELAEADVAELAMELVQGCVERQQVLDDVIRRTAEHWELERMAASDRNILRLGVYELLFRPGTPPKVAINEAIELAKKYSTENSPTFVNGVLDRIYNTAASAPADQEHASQASDRPASAATSVHRLKPEADPQARADLHVHSTASDGSFRPEELPAMAVQAGLQAFALTDHDSVEGIAAALEAASAVGIEIVPGVELTGYEPSLAAEGDIEVHIAGLFVDFHDRALRRRLRQLRTRRLARMAQITEKLRELGVEIENERVLARAHGGAVGRVHVAQEMVERGHCRDIAEAFGRYIGAGCPAYVPKEKLAPAEAVRLVKEAGGCAVLCHPGLIADVERYAEQMAAAGLEALEVHSPPHTPDDEKRLLDLARRLGLAVTGGSDFHGEARPEIRLGQETVSFVELAELRRRAATRA